MDSENNYDVVPANQSCGNISHTSIIQPTLGTPTNNASKNIDYVNNQHQASSQYDTISNTQLQPLQGGSIKKFIILFKNNNYSIYDTNEIMAIKKIINNKIFKKDHLLEIVEEDDTYITNNYNIKDLFKKSKKSLYIIRGFNKNKFVKI